MPTSLETRALLLSALLAAASGCVDMPADDEPGPPGETEQALDNGTFTTTLFPEVVKIEIEVKRHYDWLGILTSVEYNDCSATAIADDLLITASHCVKKNGVDVADYVQIIDADAENASADQAYSSYIIMSSDIYDNVDSDTETSQYDYRDFALIKFGKGTFTKYLDFTFKTGKPTYNSELTAVGYGENATKAYGKTYVDSTPTANSSGYSSWWTRSNEDHAGEGITEHGDSGGPLLYKENGQYYIVGVLFGSTDQDGYHYAKYPAITSGVYNHVSTLRTAMDTYCLAAYKDANQSGDSLAACDRTSINTALANQGFSDAFHMYQKWKHNDWNDTFTSFELPDDFTATFWEDGDGGGGSVTLTTAFSFLDQSLPASMSPWGMNDKLTSWTLVQGSSPNVSLKSSAGGGCLDVTGGGTTDGTKIQEWSCQSGNDNQVFQLMTTGTTDVYQIKNVMSGKCLNVTGSSTANGARIQQYTCSESNAANLFRAEAQGDIGRFRLVNPVSGKCVDVASGGSANGTKIQLYTCNDTSAQQFTFKKYWGIQ